MIVSQTFLKLNKADLMGHRPPFYKALVGWPLFFEKNIGPLPKEVTLLDVTMNFICKNKTGSSQVGAISKAQKYSKNNYWKHLEKFFFQKSFEIFFRKKTIFFKKLHNAENSKEAIQAH